MGSVNVKPWKNVARFSAFEDANKKRLALVDGWEFDKIENMQVKIRRMYSPPGFVVKTRLHPDFQLEEKAKKKNGKSSKRNKKDSNRGKFDASGSV